MLVSSLIPSSEKEREAVSQLQENLEPVKEKATEVAKDIGESLKPAAQEAAETRPTARATDTARPPHATPPRGPQPRR